MATVGLTVRPNAAPTALDVTEPYNNGNYFYMASFDPDGDLLTTSIVSNPAHGTVTCSDLTTYPYCSYVADAGFTGSDTFTWQASDGLATSRVATTTMLVDQPSALIAYNANGTAYEGQNILPLLSLLGWYLEPGRHGGQPARTRHADRVQCPPQRLHLRACSRFLGTGLSHLANHRWFRDLQRRDLLHHRDPERPAAGLRRQLGCQAADVALVEPQRLRRRGRRRDLRRGLRTNPRIPDVLHHRLVHVHADGQLCRVRLLHLAGQRGRGHVFQRTATLALNVHPNNPPGAYNQFVELNEGTPTVLGLSWYDDYYYYNDAPSYTFTVLTPPSHGTLTACSTGACTYTPDANFRGADSFTWKVGDGLADSNPATVSLFVLPVTAPGGDQHQRVGAAREPVGGRRSQLVIAQWQPSRDHGGRGSRPWRRQLRRELLLLHLHADDGLHRSRRVHLEAQRRLCGLQHGHGLDHGPGQCRAGRGGRHRHHALQHGSRRADARQRR